jgi:hypothetical protein
MCIIYIYIPFLASHKATSFPLYLGVEHPNKAVGDISPWAVVVLGRFRKSYSPTSVRRRNTQPTVRGNTRWGPDVLGIQFV